MSEADFQYGEIVRDIIRNGTWDRDHNVRTRWDDGTPAYTKSLISQQFRFDNTEVPILTSKFVAWKWAIIELLWIWQKKSNVVQDLRDMGVSIWDEWERDDGTIGKAYGYQLAKKNRLITVSHNNSWANWIQYLHLDQVDYLIHQLKYSPSSRRHITNLWNPDELDDMALTPCVYETQWYVKENKLHLEVRCRSNDMGLGNPFNIFQYNVLQRMVAQVTGYELGEYIFNIGDCHIYDRHIDTLREQIEGSEHEGYTHPAPELWINPNVKSFYDFTIDDFKLIDYKHNGKLNMEVAI